MYSNPRRLIILLPTQDPYGIPNKQDLEANECRQYIPLRKPGIDSNFLGHPSTKHPLFSKSNIPSRRSFNGIRPLRRPTGKTKSQYKGLPYDKHTTKTHRKSRHRQCQPFHVEGKDVNMSMNNITCEITTSPMYSIC